MRTPNSYITSTLVGCVFIVALAPGLCFSAEPAAGGGKLSETIQYLIDFVRTSECRFYRNNEEHTAGEAAAHMQRKYAYFKDEIKTPEDFIRLTATESLISGQRYSVKLVTGEKISSEAWLLQALEDYRHRK